MSEYKFVDYQKLDDDAHTDRMLQEGHGDVPEVVTDQQLEPHHVGVEDFIMEHLLEKTRTGSAEVLIEKSFDDAKSEFGSKHRNPSAYEGDINKLEEQRVANNKSEEAKYESASETPKAQRWWEAKSPDGLKLAQTKTAQAVDIDLSNMDWDKLERQREERERVPDEFDIDEIDNTYQFDPFVGDDFDIEDLGDEDFDIEDFGDEDFGIDDLGNEQYEEISYKEIDVGGTPTAVGVIKLSDGYEPSDVEAELREFMETNHSNLPFSLDSFDLSKMSQGIITYSVVAGSDDFSEEFEIDSLDDSIASSNSPIVKASLKKK